jgi:ABC-type Na+ efflux pump permease subunit
MARAIREGCRSTAQNARAQTQEINEERTRNARNQQRAHTKRKKSTKSAQEKQKINQERTQNAKNQQGSHTKCKKQSRNKKSKKTRELKFFVFAFLCFLVISSKRCVFFYFW